MPAPTITEGFEVLVQLVIAAMTTWPWSTSKLFPSISIRRAVPLRARVAPPRGAEAVAEAGRGWPGAPLAGGSEAG